MEDNVSSRSRSVVLRSEVVPLACLFIRSSFFLLSLSPISPSRPPLSPPQHRVATGWRWPTPPGGTCPAEGVPYRRTAGAHTHGSTDRWGLAQPCPVLAFETGRAGVGEALRKLFFASPRNDRTASSTTEAASCVTPCQRDSLAARPRTQQGDRLQAQRTCTARHRQNRGQGRRPAHRRSCR